MAKNISLLLVTLFLLFILIEFSAFIYLKFNPITLYPLMETYVENPDVEQKFDPEFGWVLKPNFQAHNVQVNSLGFRSSQEFNFDQNTTRKKVLLLEDSMVFGFGVSQELIFSELLNRENTDVVFINAAVNGYSTWQEYLVLKKYVHRIKPDLVILFYTQENDLFENLRRDRFYPSVSLHNGELVYEPARKSNGTPFYQKSTAYRLLNREVLHGKDFVYLIQKLDFEIQRENSYVWQVAQRILHQMAQIRDQEHFSVVVVDIPTQNQLRNPKMSRLRQALLSRAAQEESFLYYNLLDFYPKDYGPLFLPNDPH